jgi:hypothetical protein
MGAVQGARVMAPNQAFVERLGTIVGITLVVCFAFTTAAPYFLPINPTSVRLIDQQQTILQSVFMVLVGYLWGNSAGNKTKDATIETLAKTAQTAGQALTGQPEGITIGPGETATAVATEDGATISKDTP